MPHREEQGRERRQAKATRRDRGRGSTVGEGGHGGAKQGPPTNTALCCCTDLERDPDLDLYPDPYLDLDHDP